MSPEFTLRDLASALQAELCGPPELVVRGVCTLEHPRQDGIAFVERAGEAPRVSGVRALIAPLGSEPSVPALKVKKPRVAFARCLALFHPQKSKPGGIHPRAWVHPTAQVDPSASIGPLCVLAAGSKVGAGARLDARVSVGENTSIGAGCHLHPNVHIEKDCVLGEGCILEPWVHLGERVRFGDRVYFGCRSTIGAGTEIAVGCKLDNLISMGKDCKIGPHAILVGQCLLCDGVEIGRYAVLGAQVLVLEGRRIADMVQISGRGMVERDLLQPGEQLGGEPVQPIKKELKERAIKQRALEAYRNFVQRQRGT